MFVFIKCYNEPVNTKSNFCPLGQFHFTIINYAWAFSVQIIIANGTQLGQA